MDIPGLPPLATAFDRVTAFFKKEKVDFTVAEDLAAIPNPFQGSWIVNYRSVSSPDPFEGGSVAVYADSVEWVSSSANDEALIGAEFPEDLDAPQPDTLFASGADDEYDDSVCIMAIPAADSPVNGIGDVDKHATLLYFGNMSEHSEPERLEASGEWLQEVLSAIADTIPPFTASVTAVEELGHDEQPAQVWLLDSPNLQDLFGGIRAADDEIADLYDGADATRYPEYTPHVTIAYGAENVPPEAESVEEITFDRLSLWWGNEHYDFPLTGDPDTTEFEALFALVASAEAAELAARQGTMEP